MWHKKVDNRRGGRTYYLNLKTNERKWDLPLGATLATESNDRDSIYMSSTALKGISSDDIYCYVDSVTGGRLQTSLPVGKTIINKSHTNSSDAYQWKCKVDKATGNVYYVNEVIRESRWTLPDEAVLVEDAIAIGNASTQNLTSSESLVRDNNVWYERWDSSTSRVYYINKNTKQSAWELPANAVVKRKIKHTASSSVITSPVMTNDGDTVSNSVCTL